MTFYLLCGIIGGRILLKRGAQYKKWPVLIAFTDALFLILIIVLIQDSFWLTFNSIKWIGQYGSEMTFTGYWIRFPQNLVGLCFLALCSYGVWKARFVSFTRTTTFWMGVIVLMMLVNFILAPDPSWTDYTYAVRVGSPDWHILISFILSHVVLKILMFLAFQGLFRTFLIIEVRDIEELQANPRPDNSRNFQLEEGSKEVI
jgi:hypothetical protein